MGKMEFRIMDKMEWTGVREDDVEVWNHLLPDPGFACPISALLDPENMFASSIPEDAGNRAPRDVINEYNDAYATDGIYLGDPVYGNAYDLSKHDVRFLGAFEDHLYQGGTWIFSWKGSMQILGIHGIRISVANYLQGKKGILDALLQYVETLGYKKILVLWPSISLVPVLRNMGYEETKDMHAIEPITSMVHLWTKQL